MVSWNWWWVVAGIGLLNLVWSVAGVVLWERVFSSGGPVIDLYLFVGLAVLALVPLFFLALFLDAAAVRATDSPWNPDGRRWVAGGALFFLLVYVPFRIVLIEPIAAAYLFYRLRDADDEREAGARRAKS